MIESLILFNMCAMRSLVMYHFHWAQAMGAVGTARNRLNFEMMVTVDNFLANCPHRCGNVSRESAVADMAHHSNIDSCANYCCACGADVD